MFSDSRPELPPVKPIVRRWMLSTVLRLRQDMALVSAAREAHAAALTESAAWTTIAGDDASRPIVSAAENGDELVLQVGAPARSFIAAVALSSALNARQGDASQPEQEVAAIDAADLTAWSRAPAPVEREAWRHVEDSDARWFWLLVLVLLGLEHRIRRSATVDEEVRVAA